MPGDYYVPDNCVSGPGAHWRTHFLIAARQLCPDILRTLREDLLPFYREHPEWPVIVGGKRPRVAKMELGKPISPARLETHRQLLRLLKQWAEPYHIVERCIFYEALHTLQMWRNAEGNTKASDLRWWLEHQIEALSLKAGSSVPVSASGLDWRLVHPGPFHFEHEGWSVQLQTGKDWKAAARDAFEEALANHERQLQRLARKHLRTAIPTDMRRFVKWFAIYQLDETVTYKDLGKSEKRSDRTIRNGVRRASEMLGLPIRPPRRGRPKGSRDSEDSPRQRAWW